MSKTAPDIGIRLKPEDKKLKAELEKAAAKIGISLNSYLVLILRDFLRKKKKLEI